MKYNTLQKSRLHSYQQLISLLLSLCTCFALCYWVALTFSQAASFGALLSTAPTSPTTPNYFNVLNPSHNAFLSWRVDPLVATVAHILAVPPTKVFLILATVFLLGLFCALIPPGDRRVYSVLASAAHSFITTAVLYALFADDIIIWGSLAYLPFLVLCITSVFKRGDRALTWFIVCLVLSLLLALSAPWTSIVIILGAILLALLQSSTTQPRRLVAWLTFALLLAPLLVMMCAPLPHFPQYPPLAQVVPDDGLPGMIRPLVGPSFPIPVIDRAWLKTHYFFPTLILLATSLFLYCATYRRRAALKNPALFLVLCSLCLALDIFAPESLTQIAPLAVLSRLIPGLALYPLATLTFAFVIATTFFLLRTQVVMSTCAAILALTTLLINQTRPTALLQRPDAPYVYLQNLARPHEKQTPENLLLSPSYAVYRPRINSMHLKRSDRPNPRRVNARAVVRTLTTSHRPELAEKLMDGSNTERWSPMRGWQRGDEYIFAVFQKPTLIRGIRLTSGAFNTDFPGGLKIMGSTATSCEHPEEASNVILNLPTWQGTVRFSHKSPQPFYSDQQLVRIPLPISPPLTCLKIAQTGQRQFDWSVTELSFYIEP